MEPTLLDVLLGLALAYSATYVLYCWLHGEQRQTRREPQQEHEFQQTDSGLTRNFR